MQKNTKRVLAIGLPLATVAATGIAFAAWTNVTQPANVTGTVGNNGNTLTLTTGDSTAPGAVALPTTPNHSVDIYVYASNNTQASQTLTGLTGVLSAPGCTIGDSNKDFTVTDHHSLAPVAAGVQNVSQGYFTVSLNPASTDACQGASMSFAVTGS